MGNTAMIDQLNRSAATPEPAPERIQAPSSAVSLSDEEEVAQSTLLAEEAGDLSTGKRAALDEKLAAMQKRGEKVIAARPQLFELMREELGDSLPTSIASKEEIVASLGFEEGKIAGIPSRTLRTPADPSRPQLVAYAGEGGEEAMAEKMAGFKGARIQGGAARAFGTLLSGKIPSKDDLVPAMSVLFDASGLDAGIAEATAQISGNSAKDLMAAVASLEAAKKLGGYRKLTHTLFGKKIGLGGAGVKSAFHASLPQMRKQVASEGGESAAQVTDYVVHEARAQLLTQKAAIEGQMLKSGLSLEKVGLGAIFDQAEAELEPNTLNLFMQTKEGQQFMLEDVGGASTFAEADALEGGATPLHQTDGLTNEALSKLAMQQGLFPTAEGTFFRVPDDLGRSERRAYETRLKSAYSQSKGQPLPIEQLQSLSQ